MRTLDPEQQAQHHHESQVFYRGVFSSEASMEDVLREALLQDISESPQDLSESAGHRMHTFAVYPNVSAIMSKGIGCGSGSEHLRRF